MNPEERRRLQQADSKGAFGGINLSDMGLRRGEKLFLNDPFFSPLKNNKILKT